MTPESCALAHPLIGAPVSEGEIRTRLEWAATYIDDEHWAKKQERDLAIEHVRLTSVGFSRRFGITLEVSGDGASLDEPQLVSLVRQALAYRKTDGAVIEVGRISRLAVKLGEPVWAAAEDKTFCTPGAVELEDLAELVRQGVV